MMTMTTETAQKQNSQQNDTQQRGHQQQLDAQQQPDAQQRGCQQQPDAQQRGYQQQNKARALWERAREINVGNAATLPSGFSVGFATDNISATGCTVVLCEEGAVAGASVLGAAPATRETDLLRSENMVERIHGLVLSGGSAFGLDAAGGVMRLLEERGAGVVFGGRPIPVVVGASLFDLGVGGDKAPDANMGYLAASAAGTKLEVGNVGAGAGASVGKILGADFCMKSGMGAASIIKDDLIITALVAVNALGCIFDPVFGLPVAGVIDPRTIHNDRPTMLDPYQALAVLAGFDTEEIDENDQADEAMREMGQTSAMADETGNAGADTEAAADVTATPPAEAAPPTPAVRGNTTIGCILTNAALTKTEANRIAAMTHAGYARAITPVHSSFDGDAIFCMSTGKTLVHPDILGSFAALAMERAVINAVTEAKSAHSLLAARDL